MKKTKLALLILVPALLLLPALLWPKRINLLVQRAQGRVHSAAGCTVLTPGIFTDEEMFETARKQVREVRRDGLLALYDTPIGRLWYRVGAWTLPALVEQMERDAYHFRSTVKPGDVVMDIGANVGATARMALDAGASLVVAVEPEPTSLECLRRNLAAAIGEKRVIVVPEGAWNKDDNLSLNVSAADAGGSSFVRQTGGTPIPAHVTTIDRIAAQLGLRRIDLIKMHVEGAERNALAGAAETIRRYHPRLAVALEHNLDDREVIPAVVRQYWPAYRAKFTPCAKTFDVITPKTVLLEP